MITLHHLSQPSSLRSMRVLWLMEELHLTYDLICHPRAPDMQPIEALLHHHPLGRAPIIVDGELVIFETGAILEYLIHRHGQGQFAVASYHTHYPDYLMWLHAAEGTAAPALIPLIQASFAGLAASEAQQAHNRRVLALADDSLRHRDYFAGAEFTASDIMMHTYVALSARFTPTDFAAHPALAAFLGRVESRPAYQRAIQLTEPRPKPD